MKKRQRVEESGNTEREPSSFRSQVTPLLFLVEIFFLNFISRIILSPLLPSVEKELKIGHEEAGSLFFLISLGYCIMLLGSSFISSRINHRRTILLSTATVGGALLFVGFSHQLWMVRLGLFTVGMASGLYLPSGIAILTELVNPRDLGKAVSIHELAPNVSFVVAPLIAEMLLRWFSWQGIFTLFGIFSILSGISFSFFGRGGRFCGEPLNVSTFRIMLKEPSFYVMMILFSLGIGGTFGMFAMFPLYLVSEKGMDQAWANTLVGLARIAPVGASILSGWVTDRLGPKKALTVIFLADGIAVMLLGLVSGSWIVLLIFLQPMLASSFFPPGFAALSRIGGAPFKSIAVSLTMPVSFLLGGGAIPAMIGLIGEARSFSTGFMILGWILLGGAFLVRYLKFTKSPANLPSLGGRG
jgi:MFS transporter, NNP family, nitrate/nitrite transporter